MRRILILAAACLLVTVAQAAGLPDTGQVTCYTDTVADSVSAAHILSISRDNGSHPRQDCRYGRDPAVTMGFLARTGKGLSGFDYTKITNVGTVTVPDAPIGTCPFCWACTRDNLTGLTWEVKTVVAPTDLRYFAHKYTWYSTDAATNGGNAGSTGGNTCGGTIAQCNTQAYVAAANAALVCGSSDWRLPTPRELMSLGHLGVVGVLLASVEPDLFPGTATNGGYWSATTKASNATIAWGVWFDVAPNWVSLTKAEPTGGYARLVRGPAF